MSSQRDHRHNPARERGEPLPPPNAGEAATTAVDELLLRSMIRRAYADTAASPPRVTGRAWLRWEMENGSFEEREIEVIVEDFIAGSYLLSGPFGQNRVCSAYVWRGEPHQIVFAMEPFSVCVEGTAMCVYRLICDAPMGHLRAVLGEMTIESKRQTQPLPPSPKGVVGVESGATTTSSHGPKTAGRR